MNHNRFTKGQKVKITKHIYTSEGTLYKGSLVKIDDVGPFPDKDLRIIDDVGKLWYVDFISVDKLEDEK